MPKRPPSHQLETTSQLFFRQCIPSSWTCDEPQKDYGVDLRVGIAEGNLLNGHAFVVQLKATAQEKAGETVSLKLNVSTFKYLRSLLEVAMVVKYVAAESEAYWLLLKDVPQPSDGQKTVTIRIPRGNRLSQNPWPQVTDYVALVHYKKLGAMHQANAPTT